MKKESKNMPYSVPNHYFDGLAERMMQGVNAANADQDAALSFEAPQQLVFQVPNDYFDNLSQQVLDEIKDTTRATAFLQTLPSTMPFAVPETYFGSLSDQVNQRIHQSDEDLVSLDELKDIPRTLPFAVPDTYFEKINIPSLQKEKKQSTTLPLQPNFYKVGKWNNWVAAASILLIFTIGGTWMFRDMQKTSQHLDTKQQVAQLLNSVSDEDIEQYIENDLENFDVYSLMSNASAATAVDNKVKQGKTENVLDDISSEDVDAYLDLEGI